jgi:hypothetical protein
VQTYAKALSLQPGWQVSVFDINPALAEKTAAKYRFEVVESVEHLAYDIVCIAAPTQHHFLYLSRALKQRVPFIFCEKPVSYKLSELEELERLYNDGSSKVIVNYIRRFQPVYEEIRNFLPLNPPPKGEMRVVLRYRRGLLNNGTHGLDLIEFLAGIQIDFSQAVIHSAEYDAFDNDPTIGVSLPQDGFTIELESVAGTEQPVFEMELTCGDLQLLLPANGNTIRLYRNGRLILEAEDVLDNYMEAVIALPGKMCADPKMNDNFKESTDLNRRVLELMKTR